MILARETGLGPALRVVRHFAERQRFFQIKFPSGERALVLIAGMPVPSVELVRLTLGGILPWQTVWEYSPMRAGGFGDYLRKLKAMFSPPTGEFNDSLLAIREALSQCQSIEEARALLLQRERLADGLNHDPVGGFAKREPRSPAINEDWDLGPESSPPRHGFSTGETSSSAISDRYRIGDSGRGKFLSCVEAPTVIVQARRGVPLSAKQARSYPAGAVFLDGVVDGEPFADSRRELYNLGHPEGSIHTLATCEQAVLLIRKLRDLRTRNWTVFVNDGDLDSVFAVWVLLNHLRLAENTELRSRVMPLLRLEGVLDAHGPEAQYLSALPSDLLHSSLTFLKQLRKPEMVFKGYGRWSEMDLLEYLADRLRAVDELVYAPEDFENLYDIVELARGEITNGAVVVACRSDAGMNEVERQLQWVYGERLSIVIFQNTLTTYSVRQVNRNLPALLERAYERLNLLDPAVRGGSKNRWSGSEGSGLSPRNEGTGLNANQIVEAVREAFREPAISDIALEIPRAGRLLPGTHN